MISKADRLIRFLLITFSLLYIFNFFYTAPYMKELANLILTVFFAVAILTMPKLNRKVCLSFFVIGLIVFFYAGTPAKDIFMAMGRNAGLVALFVCVPIMSMPFFYDDYQNQIGNIAKRHMTSVLPFLLFIQGAGYFLSLVMAMGCLIVLYDLFAKNAKEYNIEVPFRAALLQGYAAGGLWGPAWATLPITSARLEMSLVELIPAGMAFSLLACLATSVLLWRIIAKNPELYPPLIPDKTITVDWGKVRTLFILAGCLIAAVISLNYKTGWSMFIIGPLVAFPFAISAALVQNKMPKFQSALSSYYKERIARGKGEMGLFVVGGFLGTAFEYSEVGLLALNLLPDVLFAYPALISGMVIALIVFLALFGVHPVVVAPALAVAIPPASIGLTTLTFAMALMSGWVLGVNISPFSSATMILTGLEQKNPWEIGPFTNWKFSVTMIILFSLASGVLYRLTA